MKNTPSSVKTGLQLAALLIGLGLGQGLAVTVTFTNTPAAVSNTYGGTITLQVGGLTNGETVVVQQFLDANTNGVIDSGDWLVQQFKLVDGVASLIGGATNLNVPGDSTPTNGAITAQMNFVTSGIGLPMAGRYLYLLTSPSGRFAPVTNLFSVTNVPYSQSITGNVVCSGSNVPNAVVMAFNGVPMDSTPIAGAVANIAGAYSLPVPPGTYNVIALKTNYVASGVAPARVVLGGGVTANTNLSLLPTTSSISGKMVNAANTNRGLPAVWLFPQSTNGLIGVGVTDTNGNFTSQVTASQWDVRYDSMQLPALGFARFQNKASADTTTGSVPALTITMPKGTALIYGTVKDAQNLPLAGVGLYPDDNSGQYEGDGVTDQNGNYAVAVLAGTWGIGPDSSSSPAYANYIFSKINGISLSDGQAVREDLVGVAATNQISGYLRDGSNHPISNVWVWAQATISSASFQGGVDTDATGHYAINVCNGSWTVGVNCGGGGGDSLDSQYLCPSQVVVPITNNNGVANFTALLPSSQINGYVRGNGSTPVANVNVYAYMPIGGGNGAGTLTDGTGHYSINVANGNWNVGVNCCGNNSLNSLGFLCVPEQSISVNNSTNVVSFSVPSAPYQITGHLRDAASNPIPNVNVSANNGTDNACAITDGSGFYRLYVTNGDWNVNLDCNGLSLLGYLCPGGQFVTVSNANAVVDFSALQAPYQITGWVKSDSSQPFTNLDVYAYATIGTNYYQVDSFTDSSGNYALSVGNGAWNLGVNCSGLGGGYLCPSEAPISIAGASVVTNLTIQSCGPLQILTASPLPSGQVGAYYDLYLQATSCNPNFNWSLHNGSSPLPLGLQLESNGELHGSPGTNGTFSFTVQVTDGNSDTTNASFSLTITPAPGDVRDYYGMKLEAFRQLDAVNLVQDTNYGPFNAICGIVQTLLNAVPIANVDLPTGGVRGFPPGASGIELLTLDSFASQAALDAVYTNGNYVFAMATMHNGFQYPVLTMSATVYPGAPRVSNFAAAQAINPLSPFTLQWSNPSDATTNDYLWVVITDGNGNVVFSTPEPATNDAVALRGNVTSVLVPTNTFQLGNAYTGSLSFIRVTGVNTMAYPGATGLTLVAARTRFSLAAPSSVPLLSQPASISSTQFGFLLSGAAGQTYTVLVATNAARPLAQWSALLTTNLPAGSAFIQDNQATNQRRFYRVRVGP